MRLRLRAATRLALHELALGGELLEAVCQLSVADEVLRPLPRVDKMLAVVVRAHARRRLRRRHVHRRLRWAAAVAAAEAEGRRPAITRGWSAAAAAAAPPSAAHPAGRRAAAAAATSPMWWAHAAAAAAAPARRRTLLHHLMAHATAQAVSAGGATGLHAASRHTC